MTSLEKIQAICDEALQVAEKSESPQQQTICSLITVISMMIEQNKEAKEKALNYISAMRDGRNIPKNAIINVFSSFINFEGL